MLVNKSLPFMGVRCALAGLAIAALLSSTAQADGLIKDSAWRFTLEKPADNWQANDFDDSGWTAGKGGFGTPDTPGSRVGTVWSTNQIWIRRHIELPTLPAKPALYLHHDEDAEVFINGKQVARFERWSSEYFVYPMDATAAAALRAGTNTIAVHCQQTTGGQFIDVHVIDADHIPELPFPARSTTPFSSELITPWGEKVTAENAWREYPRPALQRDQWTNLNGHWDYAITSQTVGEVPQQWEGQILVPYALEARLSGVHRLLNPDEALWYQRTFSYQPSADQSRSAERTLLHFEAVDYHSQIWLNGKRVGEHIGGNTPFQFDVTGLVREGENNLVVRVEDETQGWQLNGKQSLNPRGIWYTQVSGIWQTVWLEQVADQYIDELDVATDYKRGQIQVQPTVIGTSKPGCVIQMDVLDGDRLVATQSAPVGKTIAATVADAKLWSPATPHLYALRLTLKDAQGNAIDRVDSYAGIRGVGKVLDSEGHWRFTLNGEVIFHWGPLDQGWWPDGLLTPPSDDAMKADIQFLKDSGFNMIRKHIKVEPRRYYYHCDQMGMMLWQDQVSGGKNPDWTRLAPNPRDRQWDDQHHRQFMTEFEAMVDSLEFHPCIVVWVPFNEAWGQHRTMEVGQWMVKRDPSRIVNIASGGNYWPVGDVVDEHSYPHPNFPFDPQRYKDYVKVVGEFGGHGLPVEGHIWDTKRENWGYGGLPKNATEYKERYVESIRILKELQQNGIAAGVYTQTTDVEEEINGLMTYDRKVKKIAEEELKAIHSTLFGTSSKNALGK